MMIRGVAALNWLKAHSREVIERSHTQSNDALRAWLRTEFHVWICEQRLTQWLKDHDPEYAVWAKARRQPPKPSTRKKGFTWAGVHRSDGPQLLRTWRHPDPRHRFSAAEQAALQQRVQLILNPQAVLSRSDAARPMARMAWETNP